MKTLLLAALAAASLASPAMATTTVNYTAIFPNDPATGQTETHTGSFDYDYTGSQLTITNAVFNNGVADITGGFLSIFPAPNGFVTIGSPSLVNGTNAYQLLIGFDSDTGTFLSAGVAGNDSMQYTTTAAPNRLTPFGTTSIAGHFTFTTSAVPAVPEPATWAMMLLGFGAIGFAMRRQHNTRLARAV